MSIPSSSESGQWPVYIAGSIHVEHLDQIIQNGQDLGRPFSVQEVEHLGQALPHQPVGLLQCRQHSR